MGVLATIARKLDIQPMSETLARTVTAMLVDDPLPPPAPAAPAKHLFHRKTASDQLRAEP